MNRSHWISLAGAFALVTGLASAAEPPNIVLIMADDAGLGDVGAYRDFALEHTRTPALDALVDSGLLLTSAYTPGPMCWPTRGSLLTGKWPARWGGGAEVPTRHRRLGSMLQEAGYHTMMVGKTHNGVGKGDMPPTNWGWDRYFATFTQHDYFLTYCAPGMGEREFTNAVGYGAGLNNPAGSNRTEPVVVDEKTGRYIEQGWLTRKGWSDIEAWRKDAKSGFLTIPYEWALRYGPVVEGRGNEPFTYVTDFGSYPIRNHFESRDVKAGYLPQKFSEKGLEYIREHLAAHPEQPFFLYMPRSVVHVPAHEPPAKLVAADRRKLLGASDNLAQRALQMDLIDRNVAELVALLRESGEFENTILIFCSDNGGNEQSMGRLRGRKGQFFEGGIRTPFVLSWPAGIPAARRGQTSSLPMTLMDLAPTFLAAAGAEIPDDLDGVNLLPQWQDREPIRPKRFGDALFWGDGKATRYAIRHDVFAADGAPLHQWKLVRQRDKEELFDLLADPSEEAPVENQEVRSTMRKLLDAWLAEMGKNKKAP